MPISRHHVLLFGDQTDNVVGSIRYLYAASKRSGLLAKFLRDASDLCQIEFSNLRQDFARETPPFESLLDMAENHGQTDGSPVLVSCVLSYFARLGELVLRTERDPTILSQPRVLIGLCISLFPAALAATARSDTELARLSLEAFPSYFCWTVANHARAKRIEWPHGNWSCMISTQTDVDLQALLDEFHEEHNIPEYKRTWIGVMGRNWVTVSGPPSILKLLIAQFSTIENLPVKLLPVASAVHAPHLPVFTFESTAKPSYIWDLPVQEGACIMSTDDCVPYSSKTLGEVTRLIMYAVLRAPMMIERTFAATAEYLKKRCVAAAVSILGTSAQAGALIQTLRKTGVRAVILPSPEYNIDQPLRYGSGTVAIIGMSSVFPQAKSLEQFWQHLMAGHTTHGRIPCDRFDLDDFYDPSGARFNTMMNTDGCFLSDPGAFDACLFNMSPREAMQVDPTHRLLLMTSLEALERAGYNPGLSLSSRNRRTAVYFGQNADIWREVSIEHGIDVFTAPGILRAFSPGRVSRHFGFEGGSYSATAIQLACDGLVNRECDMALAGGAQVANSPFEFAALGKSGFLTPVGGCKTFRADADGYSRGEAVGVLVLKRLEDALIDNDNIEAVITGWGRNYSGDAPYMTQPHVDSQEKLIRQILRQANVRPGDIAYVELHGTGTAIGDIAEMKLITRVFNSQIKPDRPLHVGSVKANIGHSESAAGVSSVIKAVLMLQKGIIPPQAMITPETILHPGFANLDMSSIRIDYEPTFLDVERSRILVNSFDAAGGNTCLLIERAPQPTQTMTESDPRGWYLVTVSAQTNKSLRHNKKRLLQYLLKYPQTKLSDVAYSTTARRTHYTRKSQYTAQSTDQLIEQLKRDTSQSNQSTGSTNTIPKTIFVFSGQGTSYYGIAQELYETHLPFREYLDKLEETCKDLYPDMRSGIVSILTGRHSDSDKSFTTEENLAIVCIQLALADLWQSWGIKPDIVLGHSIGEYAALCVAGVLSVTDTIFLVFKRAKLFEKTYRDGEYGMLNLAATAEDVLAVLKDCKLDDICTIVCFNGHTSHVIGGPTSDLLTLEGKAKSKGIPTHLLAMAHAFHCKLAEQITEKLEKIAGGASFFPPEIPVVSTITGQFATQGVFNAHYIARHTRQPVRFSDALDSISALLIEEKVPSVWVEIGPSSIFLNLIRKSLNMPTSQLLPSLQGNNTNWETLSKSLGKAYTAGLPIDWPMFHRPFEKSLKLLDLPTYAFDSKIYWRPYTKATAAANGINVGDRRCEAHGFVPTATIQKIQDQKVSSGRVEVIFFSSLNESRLRSAIKDHLIEGFCVCPASVYIDMAFTAATYVRGIVQSDKRKGFDSIMNLEIKKPFVLREDSECQTIETRVVADRSDSWKISVSFHSRNPSGDLDEHACCQVVDEKSEMGSDCEGTVQNAQMRTAEIMNMIDDKDAAIDSIHNRMLYNIYGSVIKYGCRYQGVRVALIPVKEENTEVHEVVAKVKLTTTPDVEKGAFMLNPYHSDSLVHPAGFVLNTKAGDSRDVLRFASSADSINIFRELDEKETYVSFFSISTSLGGETANGYIFSKDRVVGTVTGLRFCQISRDALQGVLGKTQIGQTAVTSAHAPIQGLQCGIRDPGVVVKVEAPPEPNGHKNMGDVFVAALITETGVSPKDIEDETKLSEIGVDSLMGIAILRRLELDTGKVLPVSIFLELRTIRDARVYLSRFNDGVDNEFSQKGRQDENSKMELSWDSRSLGTYTPQLDLLNRYRSKAVLLHGDVDSLRCPLIFIAGSSGSASIYANLRSEAPIWVLEFPFLHCPSEMKYTPQDMAPLYVAAVKKIRPSGPYILGGYSAGAVHAYETARLLLNSGDDVRKLILLDMKANSPGESWAKALQIEDVACLRDILQTTDNTLSAPLEEIDNERLFASLRCMYNWKPIPMDPHRRPSMGTVMVWARWGLYQTSTRKDEFDTEVSPMAAGNLDCKSWFCDNRYTYDANGWDTLVGDVQTYVVDGNHWNMLQRPCVSEVSELINRAVDDCFFKE
ncbi:hypothetical protein GGS21DRAFT_543711 [Xylaria nigripes]|nr:hypothetical protein GGS21DRAFT_543711 [Xylaria nigripes]